MGLMTMARDHRQATGQFKEEPGNDSVSFLLHFSKKVKQDPSTPPSRWRHFHAVVPICTSYSALLPSSLPSKVSDASPFLFPPCTCTCRPLKPTGRIARHPSQFAFWGCFQKTRSNVASLTGTGLGSGLWELQGRQLFHIRDWGGGRHRCMRQGAPDRVC